jgi:ribosomal protein S18 acetylase RimI-like enzyme
MAADGDRTKPVSTNRSAATAKIGGEVTFEIRPCTSEDDQALSLLGQATFLEAFAGTLNGSDILAHCERAHAASVYRAWLADERYRLWIALAQPGLAPVGFAVLAPSDLPVPDAAPDEVEVKRIYLLNRFQGSGLGRRLMTLAIDRACALGARRLLLGVYSENPAAIAFYRRLGFETIGHRPFAVGATVCDDYVMSLAL